MQYRTTDNTKWGAGKEAQLTKVEIDLNFWETHSRITLLEDNPVQPAQISNITLTGTQLSVHLDSGVIFGPYTIPVGVMFFRGDWTTTTSYNELDIVNNPASGLYLVLRTHTSGVTFDPEAVHPVSGLPLYKHILPNTLSFLNLADTPAVFGTTGQLIAVNGTADGLVFVDPVPPSYFELVVAVSDETTAITTGTVKITFYTPRAVTLTEIFIGLSGPSSSGVVTANVKKAGSTVFSTKPTIGANQNTSLSGAGSVQGVLSTTAFAKGDKITIDIDAAGTGAQGLKVAFIGTRA